jgi:hypothetical protein
MQAQVVNGQQTRVFVVDENFDEGHDGVVTRGHAFEYVALIQTENTAVLFRQGVHGGNTSEDLALFRWLFDPLIATAKIP